MAGLQTANAYWQEFTYDAGNRKTQVDHAAAGNTTYTYNYPTQGAGSVRPHAVTSVTASGGTTWTHSYTYDNLGNTKTRLSDSGNQQTLDWDNEQHSAASSKAGRPAATSTTPTATG